MAKTDRLQRLLERRESLDKIGQVRTANLSAKAAGTEDYDYMVTSMQPIDADYTDKCFAEAERVRSQLANGLPLSYSATFDYQGSVTSDTHIRVYSDIDLLVMDGRLVSIDFGTPNSSPYSGDAIKDLIEFRQSAASVIKEKFPAVTVNNKPGKAIALSGGSLARKIDLVVGNWWDTQAYEETKFKANRGISIIDTKVPRLIRNRPFLHNYRIEEKDNKTGGLRKAVRFLKTLKYDAEPEVKMSSYDITSIVWNMPDEALIVSPNDYLGLATKVTDELKALIDNSAKREALWVPNATRMVFGDEGATLEGLRALHAEASELVDKVRLASIIRMFRQGERSGGEMTKRAWQESLPQSVKAHMY